MKGRLEMEELKGRHQVAAVLNDMGTVPVVREEWMMAEMRGNREWRQALTSCVGRGSSWKVDGLVFTNVAY